MNNPGFHNAKKQRGIATLLVLLLVGIAISAAIFGSLRYIQGSQDQTTAFHAQTQAQLKAWSGVDMLYQYFLGLIKEDPQPDIDDLLDALEEAMLDNNFQLLAGNPEAKITNVDHDNQRITVNITGTSGATGGRAESTSKIQVVYLLSDDGGGKPSGCAPFCSDGPPSVITFNRNLRLEGSISVTTQPGESYEINVKGVVTTGGNSITGVDTINATDSIQIGSGSTYKNLRSNGDIAITGSVTVSNSMMALGNICMTGSASVPGLTKANGFVYGVGSASFGQIEARGVSTYAGTSPQCNSYSRIDGHGNTFGVWLAGNNTAGSVKTSASVAHDSGTIQSLLAQGDLHITNGGSKVTAGTIGGVKKRCNAGNLNDCSGTVPSSVNVTSTPSITVSVSELTEIDVQVTSFDAYQYESSANYVFRYDSGEGRIKVTVRNVEGIDNGTYYLLPLVRTIEHGSWTQSDTYADYLCKNINGSGNCLDVQETRKTICKTTNNLVTYANNVTIPGNYANPSSNQCVIYQNGKWTVGGPGATPTIAQGVAWFEGDLDISNGEFYNTFIATGNIATSGSHKNAAPNFAGPAGSGTYSGLTLKGICSNAYFPHYPTQICNAFNNNEPLGIANYAYMAGSVEGDNYIGGNIKLGASTVAFGSVLSGNDFDSGGNTTVYGYITALGSGVVTYNAMGGSTAIIVNQLPPTYIPMGGISVGGGGPPPLEKEEEDLKVDVLWTRYL